jgi:acetyltransferase-like isoleucine patch superfamily enzyme
MDERQPRINMPSLPRRARGWINRLWVKKATGLRYRYYRWRHQKKGISMHPSVRIDRMVELYTSSPFWDFHYGGEIVLHAGVMLGKGMIVHCYGGRVEVGENSIFGPGVTIYGHGNVTIGRDCLIAMETKIISANHDIPPRSVRINERHDIRKPITIGDDVWLGASVVILAGVTVGDGCVVGAGSVVTGDLEPYSIAVGNPARVIRKRV